MYSLEDSKHGWIACDDGEIGGCASRKFSRHRRHGSILSAYTFLMSTICIGGVCIPYQALLPFLVYCLKWIAERLGLWSSSNKQPLPSACCAGGASLTTIASMEDWKSFLSKNSTTPVFVKFTASWCKPCLQMQPQLERLVRERALVCAILDVDELPDVASTYKVGLLPTILRLEDGKEVARCTGANELDTFLK